MTERLSYNVADAAAAVGVSPDVIRRAVRNGDIPVHYPTSRPVILRDDLEAWLASTPTERAS